MFRGRACKYWVGKCPLPLPPLDIGVIATDHKMVSSWSLHTTNTRRNPPDTLTLIAIGNIDAQEKIQTRLPWYEMVSVANTAAKSMKLGYFWPNEKWMRHGMPTIGWFTRNPMGFIFALRFGWHWCHGWQNWMLCSPLCLFVDIFTTVWPLTLTLSSAKRKGLSNPPLWCMHAARLYLVSPYRAGIYGKPFFLNLRNPCTWCIVVETCL